LSTHQDVYQEIRQQKSQSLQHQDICFRGLSGQMPLSTMDVSHYGQQSIGYVPLSIHWMNGIWSIGGR
jgi:hypothetical protein